MNALGQLTGGIAHDFNNLLAVIVGNLELLRKRLPTDPRNLAMIDNCMRAAGRGADLTEQMLAFARRRDLSATAVDVPDVVRGMADAIARAVGPGITIQTQFPLSLPEAVADPNHLRRALLQLGRNARDAMPDGGTLVIAARMELIGPEDANLAAGSYVCVSLADTGCGMTDEVLARAAEPFFTTKGVGGGTGLGLSTVHGFANQSGGRLILRSAVGRGTTAEIWLPAAPPNRVEAEATQPSAAPTAVRPLRILAVDDDRLVLMNTVALLEDLGHVVTEANSGAAALRILKGPAADFDLVITDQMMPGMLGTELAGAIRAQFGPLPVLLATGYSDLEPDAALELRLLPKPFTTVPLRDAIAATLRGAPGRVLPFRPRRV